MTKHLTNHGCPIPELDKPNGRAIFAKPICNSYEQAVALLKTRNLGPGDIAVVRYYLSNTNTAWDDPTGLPVRMVMGVGGANAQADDDIYIFNDSRIDGGSYVTADDVEAMLVEFLSAYATKDDIKAINAVLKADEAWKELVNNSFEENTNDHENFSRDIDELRKKLDNINIPDVDLSDYATKEYVDELFDSIEIPDVSNLVSNDALKTELDKKADVEDVEELTSKLDTKANAEDVYTREEITEILETTYVTEVTLLNELNNKADVDDVKEISNKLDNKVDASYVENYFETNVEDTVNQIIDNTNIPGIVEEEIANQDITQQVSDAVDEKLKDFEGVTTDSLDEALQNNEYFTTNVITPIETVTEKVNTIETQIKDLDADIDGSEIEDEWEITLAVTPNNIDGVWKYENNEKEIYIVFGRAERTFDLYENDIKYTGRFDINNEENDIIMLTFDNNAKTEQQYTVSYLYASEMEWIDNINNKTLLYRSELPENLY